MADLLDSPEITEAKTTEDKNAAIEALFTSDSEQREQEAAEPTQAATPDDTPEPPKTEKQPKPRNSSAERMLQATQKEAQAREALAAERQRASELEARLARLEQARQTQTQPETPKTPKAPEAPKGDKFTFQSYDQYLGTNPDATYDDWQDAKLEAHAEWRETKREEKEAGLRAQREATELMTAHQNRLKEARAKYPDYDTVVAKDVLIPPTMIEAILRSPHSHDLLYFLGTHPEEAVALANDAAVSPAQAVPIIRRYLESQIRTGAAPQPDSALSRRSAAAPPVSRVGGTASAEPADPDDLEFGPEFMRLGNAADKRRQQSGRW